MKTPAKTLAKIAVISAGNIGMAIAAHIAKGAAELLLSPKTRLTK